MTIIVVGGLGMVVNLLMLVLGANSPILATVCGVLIAWGLVILHRRPSQYELSPEGVAVYSWGRKEFLLWEEIDLSLSKSDLRSRAGKSVPLVPVREGQKEFNRALIQGLRSQIDFESDWLRRNYQSDNLATLDFQRKTILWGLLISVYCIGMLVFIATQGYVRWATVATVGAQIFPAILTIWVNFKQERAKLPATLLKTVQSKPAPKATLTTEGVRFHVAFDDLGNEKQFKGDLLEGVILSKALIDTAPQLTVIDTSLLVNPPDSPIKNPALQSV